MTQPTSLDIERILQILPHRWPFVLVDRVTEVVPHERIRGHKCVSMNEPWFLGHFPRHPILPGVLVGGQVGIADHLSVGDGAKIAAKSGVIGDVPAGATVAGYPAVERHRWLRGLAELYRLASGTHGAVSEVER